MLEATKIYNEMLRRAGLKRGDYRIRTPYNKTKEGWDSTEITIMRDRAITKDILERLLEEELRVTEVEFEDGKIIYTVEPHYSGPKFRKYYCEYNRLHKA